MVERSVKGSLRNFGIDISYVRNKQNCPEMYMNCLRGAMSVKKPLNIIQVGANDGKHNDPIYDFVRSNKHHTNIVLVEPIETVIPHLERNYTYHPSAEVVNKAIGRENGTIRLYSIKEKYWGDIDTGYGDNWPDYRIATGVTTTNKNQLLNWISKNVQTQSTPNEVLTYFDVEIISPRSIIDESDIINEIQLLQVDAEGMDDDVVYSFFDDNIYPNIINIEKKHLSKESMEEYDKKLQNKGYNVYNYTSNEMIAIK